MDNGTSKGPVNLPWDPTYNRMGLTEGCSTGGHPMESQMYHGTMNGIGSTVGLSTVVRDWCMYHEKYYNEMESTVLCVL